MKRRVEYRGVAWNIEDPQTPDWPFWDRWEDGDFESETIDILDRLVTPGSTFIDIGAWCGPFSLWAAGTAASVIAVEPDPVAFQLLQYNAEANYNNITTVNAAIHNYVGTCQIQAPDDVGWGVCTTHLSDDGIDVPCLTMEALFGAYEIQNPSLVKIDVEGAESIILERAAPFLAERGVALLVSMHGSIGLDGRSVNPAWFNGFSSWERVDDSVADDWKSILALP